MLSKNGADYSLAKGWSKQLEAIYPNVKFTFTVAMYYCVMTAELCGFIILVQYTVAYRGIKNT